MSAAVKESGTRQKILQVAHRLFGQKGYDSVSVREISKAADVNISAINYHFENKENLFKEVVRSCVGDMSEKVKELYQSFPDCDANTLALLIFDFFMRNSESLKLSFKITVLDSHFFPGAMAQEDEFIGPPGGKVVYDAILKEKPNAAEEDVIWAVRTIFGIVVHKGLVLCGKCVDARGNPFFTEEEVKKDISRVVKVVLGDL